MTVLSKQVYIPKKKKYPARNPRKHTPSVPGRCGEKRNTSFKRNIRTHVRVTGGATLEKGMKKVGGNLRAVGRAKTEYQNEGKSATVVEGVWSQCGDGKQRIFLDRWRVENVRLPADGMFGNKFSHSVNCLERERDDGGDGCPIEETLHTTP